MNLIIVGAGGHAQSWRKNIERHENWDIVGIVDTDTEKLDHASDLWNVDEDMVFTTISEAIRWGTYDIDVALITTPTPTHHLLATEALESGLNVILEKNMASTIEQGQELTKLAQSHPELCTAMGHQYRYRPNWWTLRQLLTSKECPIGKLSHIRGKIASYSGDARHGWRSWLRDIFAEDMMVHHIDCLRFCTNMEIIQIQAQVFRPKWSSWLASSTVFANLVLAPHGSECIKEDWVYCQYYGDWQTKGLLNDWEIDFRFYGSDGSLRLEPPTDKTNMLWEEADGYQLIGEQSGAKLKSYLDIKGKYASDSQIEIREIPKNSNIENRGSGYIDQAYILEQMYQGIKSKGKKQPTGNFEDSFKSFIVTRGAILSSRSGKSIWLPQYWLEPVDEPSNLKIV
ncbi:MAG: hypothetical protein GF364_17640 [Candidatus Lokiarchaeota archaeon]|nr:hypothetical protein [Candidatus Lokiarchaeota archaeon]